MVRKVLILLLLLNSYLYTFAQFSNKDWYISPKISFADYSNRHDWEGYSIRKVPPITLAVEKGVTDYLSVGSLLGFNRDKYVNDTLSTNIHRYSDLVLGGTANVHFAGWIEKWSDYNVFLGDWDFYAGFSILFKWNSSEESDVWNEELQDFQNFKNSSFDIKMRPLVGVRYFVTDNVSMLLEVGSGNIGVVTTGITIRVPHHDF